MIPSHHIRLCAPYKILTGMNFVHHVRFRLTAYFVFNQFTDDLHESRRGTHACRVGRTQAPTLRAPCFSRRTGACRASDAKGVQDADGGAGGSRDALEQVGQLASRQGWQRGGRRGGAQVGHAEGRGDGGSGAAGEACPRGGSKARRSQAQAA
jgi:hypothetical protein